MSAIWRGLAWTLQPIFVGSALMIDHQMLRKALAVTTIQLRRRALRTKP